MWPDRVSNPGPLTYESGALPTALRGLARCVRKIPNRNTGAEKRSHSPLCTERVFLSPDVGGMTPVRPCVRYSVRPAATTQLLRHLSSDSFEIL